MQQANIFVKFATFLPNLLLAAAAPSLLLKLNYVTNIEKSALPSSCER
jgi:hypothetical protein